MMKHSIFIMLFMSLFLGSCNQEDLLAEQENNQEVYTVRLNFSGDIQTEESPLSRVETESRDLYGIQVYKDGNYFAAGMFDNTNDITINLLAGGSYKFVCTAIKDGKDKHYYNSSNGGYGGCYNRTGNSKYGYKYYYDCFYGSKILWPTHSNSFYYTTESVMNNLSSSYTSSSVTSASVSMCREIDRFYGELDNYTPSVNGIVNLELKRVSFGIKVKVSNITDGDVAVKCYNNYNTFVDVSGLTSNYESEGTLFSMANVYDAWQYASSYLENITMVVTWNRGVGVTQSWTKTIQVKRNAMNTIRIKLGADDNDIGVGVTPEGGEMEGEDEEIPLG